MEYGMMLFVGIGINESGLRKGMKWKAELKG